MVEDIGGHLEYFQELEHATRMLNHPGESLIFQADFLYMVERVDICIDFLKGHVSLRVLYCVYTAEGTSSDIIGRPKFIFYDSNNA